MERLVVKMKLLLLNVIFVVLLAIVSAQKSYENYKVYLVKPSSLGEIDALHKLEVNNEIDFWDPLPRVPKPLHVMTSEKESKILLEVLETNKIPYEILVDNLEE